MARCWSARTSGRWKTCAAGASACPASRRPAGSCCAASVPKRSRSRWPFDQIADAVAAGELEAGVMIHEELLYYPQLGLRRVVDLGAEWCQRHDLPLPVGLNVIRRDLGTAAMQRICAAIRRSLEYALDHSDEALARVSRFGRGAEGQCTEQFVAMFANEDSVRMPADVRTALRVLFCQVVDLGLSPTVPPIDIIEGSRTGSVARQSRVA